MDFSNIRFQISLRLLGLLVTAFFLGLFVQEESFFVTILFLALIAFQAFHLIKNQDAIFSEMKRIVRSAESGEIQQGDGVPSSLSELTTTVNNSLLPFETKYKELEAKHQYLKTIVQHLGIGIVTFNQDGEIQIFNSASKKLLKISQAKNISNLSRISPALVESFERLQTGGNELLQLEIDNQVLQLSIYAIELNLQGEEFKLISLQNLKNELDEQEMESWQKLIRVLTHEIMNSVTPISSLASTVDKELMTQLTNNQVVNNISNDDIEELHLAVHTIQRRSEGLIRFVSDFRNLAQVPNPILRIIKVKELYEHVITLMKNQIDENGISIKLNVRPEHLEIRADHELMDQVLINLIKNAIEAFDEEQEFKEISLVASVSEFGRTLLRITDNGEGIEEEALTKIFIPFFTTKQRGSGIGLSLTRQIMRQHDASISVKSKLNQGTEFTLQF